MCTGCLPGVKDPTYTVFSGELNVIKKKIIIIGGGIAGLSAGCYLRMNGYQTVIYEMHSVPGGLCPRESS